MIIQPLFSNVLIEPLKENEKIKGGVYIPESIEKEKPQRGRVVSVGPGKINHEGVLIKPPVEEGDEILFNMYGPNEVKINDKDYLIANENDILAIIKEQ